MNRAIASVLAGGVLLGAALVARVPWQNAGMGPAARASAAGSTPAALAGRAFLAPASRPLTVAEQRAIVWDAHDVMAAAEHARINGTPDEKWWAAELVAECVGFRMSPSKSDAQRRAKEEIARRCSGVAALSARDRIALIRKLRHESTASTTEFGVLRLIASRQGDNSLSDAEMERVQAALYSDDPLLRREGAGMLWLSTRRLAKSWVLFTEVWNNQPLSDFEQLEQCALGEMCDAVVPTPQPRDEPAQDRIIRLAVRDALQRRAPLQEVLQLVR